MLRNRLEAPTPANPQTPRLYLDAERIAALRTAVTGTHAPLWQELRDLANRAVRRGPPAYREDDNWSGSEQLWQREVGNAMPVLAMAYVVSGDRKYLEAAQAWALASCGYRTWGLGRIDGMDLAAGHQLFGLGIVYDMDAVELDRRYRRLSARALVRPGLPAARIGSGVSGSAGPVAGSRDRRRRRDFVGRVMVESGLARSDGTRDTTH